MIKFKLFNTQKGKNKLVGNYDKKQRAEEAARELIDDQRDTEADDALTMFDFRIEPYEASADTITDRVKSYEDACKALGIEPMNEAAMEAAGFRLDEIARRKLEIITEALNEGWIPDYNNTSQAKYAPWFYIEPNHQEGATSAGLAYANTSPVPTYTHASVGSRLCFKTPALARYAGNTFKGLYARILVELL